LTPADDAPPLDFGLLEIHQKTKGQTGGSQVVKTLGRVFVGEPFGTLQLHHQHVFDKEIGKILADRVALVGNGKRCFDGSPDAWEAEFSEQSTLVDLFEESGAQRVGDPNTAPSTFSLKEFRSVLSAFIRVHLHQ